MKINNSKLIIKASENPIQISLCILSWLMPLFFIFLFHRGNFLEIANRPNHDIKIIILYSIGNIGITFWLRSVNMTIEDEVLSYRSGFVNKTLSIDNISEIASEFNFNYKDLYFIMIYPENDYLRFNIRYFRKKDIIKLLNHIILLNSNIKYDKSIEKLINN